MSQLFQFQFQFKKPKKCIVCGEVKAMFRRQKTCDECRAATTKPCVPKIADDPRAVRGVRLT